MWWEVSACLCAPNLASHLVRQRQAFLVQDTEQTAVLATQAQHVEREAVTFCCLHHRIQSTHLHNTEIMDYAQHNTLSHTRPDRSAAPQNAYIDVHLPHLPNLALASPSTTMRSTDNADSSTPSHCYQLTETAGANAATAASIEAVSLRCQTFSIAELTTYVQMLYIRSTTLSDGKVTLRVYPAPKSTYKGLRVASQSAALCICWFAELVSLHTLNFRQNY